MEHAMFCFQCEQTAGCTGCTGKAGACGKSAGTAKLQDELPLSMVLSWYEQKAVCILLTLLHLGIRNIRLGPTLPAFLSPNVLNYLVDNFGIAPITTPEADLKQLLK